MSHETEYRPEQRQSIGQPSAEEVHDIIHPDRKGKYKERPSRGKQVGAAAAILAGLVTAGLGGAKWAESQREVPEFPVTPTAEAPVDPSVAPTIEPTAPETQTPEPTGTETETSGELEQFMVEQTTPVEIMDQMSLEEYAKLSIADRVAYGIDKFGEAFPADDLNREPYGDAWAIPGYFWQTTFGNAYNDADPLVRAKLAGVYSYYTTDKGDGEISDAYNNNAQNAIDEGGEGIGSPMVWEYLENGDIQDGIDRDGQPIRFMNITYRIGAGEEVENSTDIRTGQAIYLPIKLLDGNTVAFYALGYTTEGKESPVKDYPY